MKILEPVKCDLFYCCMDGFSLWVVDKLPDISFLIYLIQTSSLEERVYAIYIDVVNKLFAVCIKNHLKMMSKCKNGDTF